jgi:hypothetical protein
MKAADLNRLIVVCALVSDLYCLGYNPRQSLGKDSNLARAAARYKIDVDKVGAAVRVGLTTNKDTKVGVKRGKTSPSSQQGRREPSKARTTK